MQIAVCVEALDECGYNESLQSTGGQPVTFTKAQTEAEIVNQVERKDVCVRAREWVLHKVAGQMGSRANFPNKIATRHVSLEPVANVAMRSIKTYRAALPPAS
ncbi:hypothetical protein TNCT_53061 [Trichonephila clavata]|uniref:Uncharacterized protein n=1 Tax=Trichonephila clavata TaxID=2740835 RepID=A0A8X6JLG1_TRICU|nr:hypothetical protein TNCT_53061 [Trichonephila clavata]